MYARLVTVVRLIFGVQMTISGLNWWVKLIDPYPSLSDFAHHTLPVGSDAAHNLVPALIGA